MHKPFKLRLMATLAVTGMVLGACGDGGDSPATIADSDPAPVENEDEPAGTSEGVAILTPLGESGVSGETILEWNPDTQVMTVTIRLEGVEEGATYSSQITPGCDRGTGHIYKLDSLVGRADGTVQETVELSDVGAIELDGSWAVKVGRPPGGTPGGGPQACGEVGPRG